MEPLKVNVLSLPPMRVVCINGFGESPEAQAFEKLRTWAQSSDLLAKPHRLFGFNNPDPSPGSPNYGYELWMTVDDSVAGSEEARIIKFPGGLYAVTRCIVNKPWDDIPSTWQALVKWMEGSKYHHGRHQWLEEHIGPLGELAGDQPFILDLHLPIGE